MNEKKSCMIAESKDQTKNTLVFHLSAATLLCFSTEGIKKVSRNIHKSNRLLPFPFCSYTLLLYPPSTFPFAIFLSYHFLPSSTQNTVDASNTNPTKSLNPNASVWNTPCSGGK